MGFLDLFKKQKLGQVPKDAPRVSEHPKTSQSVKKSVMNTNCPYCSTPLDPVPGRKKKCPHCGKFIFVRTRPSDRQRVLVTEEGAEQIEEEWQRLQAQKTEAIKAEIEVANKNALEGYEETGLEEVEVFPAFDEYCCLVCKAAAGVYSIKKVPSLPISGCTSAKGCRCTYLPVVD